MAEVALEEPDARLGLTLVEAVEQDRAAVAGSFQLPQVMSEVEPSGAGCRVAGIAVLLDVLGVGEGDVVAEQVDGLGKHLLLSAQLAPVIDVGPIEHHLQARRPHLVQELTSLPGGVDDVVDLRLEHEGDATLLGDLDARCHRVEQVGPCAGIVVGVVPRPHAVRIPTPGTERNFIGAMRPGSANQSEQSPQRCAAPRRVGVDQVGVTGHGVHRDPPVRGRRADALGQPVIDRVRHLLHADGGVVPFRVSQTMSLDRVEHLCDGRAHERVRENAELHSIALLGRSVRAAPAPCRSRAGVTGLRGRQAASAVPPPPSR